MSELTPNLGLFKYDPTVDGKEVFSIETALNDNWDILDTKSGSPETVVDGTTWYRRFTDGWKEQGGEVSLSQIVLDWEQPALTENGTHGGNTCAAWAEGTSSYELYPAYQAFDNKSNTAWLGNTDRHDNLYFYTPTPIKVISLSVINQFSNNYTTAFTLYGSNTHSDYTNLGYYTLNSGTTSQNVQINATQYYKYFRFYIESWYTRECLADIRFIAKCKMEVANSITFPVAFTNTNYSYTFANQDGGGMDAYVSNKTTTGMTLSNTNSGRASWTACGY